MHRIVLFTVNFPVWTKGQTVWTHSECLMSHPSNISLISVHQLLVSRQWWNSSNVISAIIFLLLTKRPSIRFNQRQQTGEIIIFSSFKGIFLPLINFCWKCTHPQVIQDTVDTEFVSSSEQIWRKFTLHHLLTNGSSVVNGCRQNESPNSW